MSHYTNPAFCQKSEFYPRMAPQQNNHKLTSAFSTDFINKSMILVDQNSMQRYAIVPTDDDEDVVDSNHEIIEMYNGRAHRYAVIPTDDDESCIGEDFEYSTTRVNDNKDQPLPLNTRAIHHFKQSHITPTKSKPFILNATKPTNSNQQLQQKHKNTPNIPIQLLDDSNHEFIEMYNGRAHRYAVIATDDDENCIGEDFEFSTSGISDNMNQSLPINTRAIHPFKNYHGTHIKSKPFILNATKLTNSNQQLQQKPKITPNVPIQLLMHCDQSTSDTREVATTKNAIATQKLHELLSTPRKCKQEGLQRYGSYQTIIQKSPNQFQLKELYSSQQATKLSPQKLQYDDQKSNVQCIEPRTTAIISPRLHQQSIYNETTLSEDKTPSHESFQKVESATTTIGIISLMLILIGVLNSGLCLYMVTDVSKIQPQFRSI